MAQTAARSKKVRFYDPDCSEKQKKCTFNHHCHPNVAFLAQVFMRDSMGSGKSPTKEETQRISFLLAEGFKVSEIHRRMSKFSLKAMRRWCQKLKAGVRSFLWSLHPSFVLRAFSVLSWGFHGVRHLTCSFPYLEAHGTNLCVPWCCTSRFCMSWRGGVKQKLGDSPIKKIP